MKTKKTTNAFGVRLVEQVVSQAGGVLVAERQVGSKVCGCHLILC